MATADRVAAVLGRSVGAYLGGWAHIPSGLSAEILAAAGFDWCCVDRQHGIIDEGAMFDMLRVLDGTDVTPFVRVSCPDPFEIGRALDGGAHGVIVPVVRTLEDACAAARACRFAPAGTRSWATTRLKLKDPSPEPSAWNERTMCIVMIETATASEIVDEIAGLPDVDGLFVGPADLRLELGSPQAATEVCDRVVAAARRHGKLAGVFAGGGAAETWLRRGFRFVAVESDSVLLHRAAVSALEAARKAETTDHPGGAHGAPAS
jgi:4-hydroxy-2-oxoheptanedioate aldolase